MRLYRTVAVSVSTWRLAPFLGVALFASACAMEPDVPGDGSLAVVEQAQKTLDVVSAVKAHGSGCPQGTFSADVSPDGLAVTLTFSAYEVVVEPGQSSEEKTCNIQLDLRASKDAKFSVATLYYSGFALLESEGMTAEQTAAYSFKGPAPATSDSRTSLVGPADDEFVFWDDVQLGRRKHSKCGKSGKLNMRTGIRIDNNDQNDGWGYLNTLAADGEVQLRVGLEATACI